jgi:hypothetical protein
MLCFCILCKARILEVKVHGSKVQAIKNTPRKKSKISAPSAIILRGLRKLAAYHWQVQIYTTYNKVTIKLKFGFIEEFYGDPVKNIKGACECLKALLQYSVLWDLNPGLHLMQTLFIFNLSKAHNY